MILPETFSAPWIYFTVAVFSRKLTALKWGDKLDIGNLGFTLNYQISDNFTMRTSYMSNVFGDNEVDNSVIRIQFVYAWHRLMENMKKLKSGH